MVLESFMDKEFVGIGIGKFASSRGGLNSEKVAHDNNGNYGYRRIALKLRKTIKINHKKVQRLMRALGLEGKGKAKKYRSCQGEVGRIADNLLQRDFTARQALFVANQGFIQQ